jgi:MYXO-CTERM domain-containing protein
VALVGRDDKDPPTPDFDPPDGYDWGRVGYSDAGRGSNSVAGSYFSQYQASGGGTASFALNVTTISNLLNWTTGPPPQWYEQISAGNPNLRIKLRVDYEWDAVPERGTWLLMALGLGALGAWARRRRVSAPAR